MDATLGPAVEPNNAVAAAADERLKHAYQQIASADEQLARVTRRLSELEHGAPPPASAVRSQRPTRGTPVLRGVIGLVLAAGIVGAAFVLQSSWGDAARLMIARWVPAVLASSAPFERRDPHAPLGSVQVAAADPTALPATPPATATPPDAAPVVAALPPELSQQLQTITQDIADLEQKIEQLRAAQEQAASDNARAVEELKANQEQTTRLIAKLSEPNAPRARTSSASPPAPGARPVGIAPRPPTQAHALPQARSLPPPQDQ